VFFIKDRFEDNPRLLIEKFNKGYEPAFAWIRNFFWNRLLFFAKQLLGDEGHAEEIVSDNFIKLWNKRADFEDLSKIKAFLYIAIRNSVYDFKKHSKVVKNRINDFSSSLEEYEDDALSLMLRTELLNEISKEINKLPKKYLAVCKLIFYDGLNSEEIAERLNLSVKTIRNIKALAAKQVQTVMLKKGLLLIALVLFNLF